MRKRKIPRGFEGAKKGVGLRMGGEGREKVPNQPDLSVSSTSRGSVACEPSVFRTAVTQLAAALAFQSLESRVAASILDELGFLHADSRLIMIP